MSYLDTSNNTMTALLEHISENGFEGMGKAIQILMNEAMKVERAKYLKGPLLDAIFLRFDAQVVFFGIKIAYQRCYLG